MIQAHILYSGTVQGVGFRYTTVNYARQLAIKGWVKNLPDGRVEVVAEGPDDQVKELSKTLDQHFQDCISDKKENFLPADGQFKDFKIVF